MSSEDPNIPLLTSCEVSKKLMSTSGDHYEEVQDDHKSLERERIIIKPKRKIVIEPILAIVAAVGVPYLLAISLYVYQRFEIESLGVYNINISHLNNSFKPKCYGNISKTFLLVTQYAQYQNSLFFILAGLLAGFPTIITAVFLGPYSDQAGRKYAIVTPLVATVVSTLCALIIVFFRFNVWWLLLVFLLEAVGGGPNVLLMGCFSYIVDITDLKDLQFRLTVVELIMIIPASVVPVGMGYWIANLGYSSAVLAALIGTILALLYAIFFVPETITKSENTKFWTTNHVTEIMNLFMLETEGKRMLKLRWLYMAFIPVMIVSIGNNLTILFLKNIPFCWDSTQVGIYIAVYMAFAGIGGVVSSKLLKYCIDDHGLALVSGISSVIKYVYHALVWNTPSVYISKPYLYIITIIKIVTTDYEQKHRLRRLKQF